MLGSNGTENRYKDLYPIAARTSTPSRYNCLTMQAARLPKYLRASALMLLGVMMLVAQDGNTARGHGAASAAQEVLQMKRDYDSALLRGDSRWFERAFADDYVLIVGNAKTYGKSEIVKQLASREVVWKAAAGRDMKIRTYGDTAIVTGHFTGKWPQNGKPVNVEERFTSVWVRDRGRWKAVSEHTSDVPAE